MYRLIKERGEGAGDITEAIAQIEELMSGAGADLRNLKKAISEAMPKSRQGRPTVFNPAIDPDRFLALSSELSRACDPYLSLREQFPTKSHKELLDFLQHESPKETDLMRKHEGYISQTMNDPDFRSLKTHETRARRLAAAIAGKALFEWSFTYAVQRAGEFRRFKGIDPEE